MLDMNLELMNLELRKQILGMSLIIEDKINQLLLVILQVGKERKKRKALGNKSSSMSLNSKANLLLDLDILERDEYKNINLFSEFRNQFIHNIECYSFIKAGQLSDSGSGKKLLQFASLTEEDANEENYITSYLELFNHIIHFVDSKIKSNVSEHIRNFNTLRTIMQYVEFRCEEELKILKRIENICENNRELNGEELLILIRNEIGNELTSDARTERLNEYDKALENFKYFYPTIPSEMI